MGNNCTLLAVTNCVHYKHGTIEEQTAELDSSQRGIPIFIILLLFHCVYTEA